MILAIVSEVPTNYLTYTTTLQYSGSEKKMRKHCPQFQFRNNCNTQGELKTKAMRFFFGGRGEGTRCIIGDVQMANCLRAPVTGLLRRIMPNQLIGIISC